MRKIKLAFLMLLFSAFNAKALDVIPQEFRGVWVGDARACVDVYMNGGTESDGLKVESTRIGWYESESELIRGTGLINAQGAFAGKFKHTYADSVSKGILTFAKTANGMVLTSVVGKEKISDKYVRCTLDDYKAAMLRLGGILINKPLDKADVTFDKEWAKTVLLQYSKEPEFGITPQEIHHAVLNGQKPVVTRNGNTVNVSVGNAISNVFNNVFKSK